MESKDFIALSRSSNSPSKGIQIMKIIIALVVGIIIGFTIAKVGPHKIIDQTSKGIQKTSNVTTKALDSVNKKVAQ